MGKSFNNYIVVFDSPSEKYGKVMSIPDNLILNYFNYATKVDPYEIDKINEELESVSTQRLLSKSLQEN